jgi:hypothetical protein
MTNDIRSLQILLLNIKSDIYTRYLKTFNIETTALDERVTDELGRIWKEAVMA